MKSPHSDLKSSRTTRAVDVKSQRVSRFLPYIKNNSRQMSPAFRIRSKPNSSKQQMQTHVRRYDNHEAMTVLSIRFASSHSHNKKQQNDKSYIKHQPKQGTNHENQQNNDDKLLPYLKYKKFETPQQALKNMGYDPDIRTASEIYSDKIQEKKFNYLNKMEALKRDLDNCSSHNKRHQRMQRSRIQVKILGQQIRRKRQRQIMVEQQRKGHRMLQTLIKSQDEIMTV